MGSSIGIYSAFAGSLPASSAANVLCYQEVQGVRKALRWKRQVGPRLSVPPLSLHPPHHLHQPAQRHPTRPRLRPSVRLLLVQLQVHHLAFKMLFRGLVKLRCRLFVDRLVSFGFGNIVDRAPDLLPAIQGPSAWKNNIAGSRRSHQAFDSCSKDFICRVGAWGVWRGQYFCIPCMVLHVP